MHSTVSFSEDRRKPAYNDKVVWHTHANMHQCMQQRMYGKCAMDGLL